MDTTSIWRAQAPAAAFAMLQADIETDVLVIGGGITGVTLALLLAEQGRRCVLLEAQEIGSGTTGHSTGNLYVTLSQGLHAIVKRWGRDVARELVSERASAIDFIEGRSRNASGVEFTRCPMLQFARTGDYQSKLEQELKAVSQAGVAVRQETTVPTGLPPPSGPVFRLDSQAQFQPQAYVAHLAQRAVQAGAVVHEHSRVLDIDFKTRTATTVTGTVKAQEIVTATHSPKGIHLVHAEMPVHREYGVAFEIGRHDPGPGIFWWKGDEGLSIRTLTQDGKRYLICVGQEHKTGSHNAKAGLMAVESLAASYLDPGPAVYRWSAQNYRGHDGLPYIGRDHSGCFVATGFSTDGLVWGTVAARIIAAQLAGQDPAFARHCAPGRFTPLKGAASLVEENVTVVKHLAADYLTRRQQEQLSSLAPGDSAIVAVEGESVAAFRAPDGELFAVSPVCTHMGCKVHWNSVETSWDCPCHGSRFRPDGTVIEGPALKPLQRRPMTLGPG
jgi:glycine/D-amino acid oxidase-like deaminating enzyme/nitrite reductase/ring-hydroxylating ferredoxin subunit